MPRFPAAIAVILLVATCIGVNTVRFPVVFDMAAVPDAPDQPSSLAHSCPSNQAEEPSDVTTGMREGDRVESGTAPRTSRRGYESRSGEGYGGGTSAYDSDVGRSGSGKRGRKKTAARSGTVVASMSVEPEEDESTHSWTDSNDDPYHSDYGSSDSYGSYGSNSYGASRDSADPYESYPSHNSWRDDDNDESNDYTYDDDPYNSSSDGTDSYESYPSNNSWKDDDNDESNDYTYDDDPHNSSSDGTDSYESYSSNNSWKDDDNDESNDYTYDDDPHNSSSDGTDPYESFPSNNSWKDDGSDESNDYTYDDDPYNSSSDGTDSYESYPSNNSWKDDDSDESDNYAYDDDPYNSSGDSTAPYESYPSNSSWKDDDSDESDDYVYDDDPYNSRSDSKKRYESYRSPGSGHGRNRVGTPPVTATPSGPYAQGADSYHSSAATAYDTEADRSSLGLVPIAAQSRVANEWGRAGSSPPRTYRSSESGTVAYEGTSSQGTGAGDVPVPLPPVETGGPLPNLEPLASGSIPLYPSTSEFN